MARKTRQFGSSDEENLEIYEQQLARLMEVANVHAEYQLCVMFDLKPANASGWRARRSLPPSFVVEACESFGASIDYVIFGIGQKWRTKKGAQLPIDKILNAINESNIDPMKKANISAIAAKINTLNPQEKNLLFAAIRVHFMQQHLISYRLKPKPIGEYFSELKNGASLSNEIENISTKIKNLFSKNETEILLDIACLDMIDIYDREEISNMDLQISSIENIYNYFIQDLKDLKNPIDAIFNIANTMIFNMKPSQFLVENGDN
ncbi:hypothetical protein [Sulfuricurvum sp.]|uniref:hypothetical protein n=1 Tax=Sulfuricurvum sp. TaxID=2025608 RepID=UPI003BB589F0